MTMKAGDCAFIPRRWPGATGGWLEHSLTPRFHFVQSPAQRSISRPLSVCCLARRGIHVWFHGERFDARSCEALWKS